jgi:DNA-binding NarL/FixJ family response regulator
MTKQSAPKELVNAIRQVAAGQRYVSAQLAQVLAAQVGDGFDKPELAVLMLSMHREDQYAIRSLKAGASGYLTKQSAPRELVNAIRQVAAGQRYVSAQLAQVLAAQLGEDHEKPVHDTLSDREYQTLTMIASGKTVSEIARELSLSVKTVSEYRSRLLSKMKLKTSAELTHYAIRNQLID